MANRERSKTGTDTSERVFERDVSVPVLRMKKTASLYTLGCRLNQAETALLAERLRAAGYALVPFGAPAHLGIIHTCTVTAEADAKSRKAVRAFIRKNPEAFVAAIGCYSEVAREHIAQIPGVDLIVGNCRKLDLLDYVTDTKNETPRVVLGPIEGGDFTLPVCGDSRVTRRANLKVQDGCDAKCSYCVVPLARGTSRSRETDNLIEEARNLVARGAKEIVLTGVNVGAYQFQGSALSDVIERLNTINGLERIRISSIEMTQAPEAVFDWMNDPDHTLVPFLHIPLQSGSDAVLKRMNRPYAAADFYAFLERAAAAVSDLCVGTDVLVGFPGETDADFDATCRLVEDTCIAYAHAFTYSARPGVPAAHFPDPVDPRVIRGRGECVRRLSAGKHRRFLERYIGKTRSVLFETVEDGRWAGYTDNYIRVAACSAEDLTNEIRSVLLEEPRGRVMAGRILDG